MGGPPAKIMPHCSKTNLLPRPDAELYSTHSQNPHLAAASFSSKLSKHVLLRNPWNSWIKIHNCVTELLLCQSHKQLPGKTLSIIHLQN